MISCLSQSKHSILFGIKSFPMLFAIRQFAPPYLIVDMKFPDPHFFKSNQEILFKTGKILPISSAKINPFNGLYLRVRIYKGVSINMIK